MRRFKQKFSKTPTTTLMLARPSVSLLLSLFSGLRMGVVDGLVNNESFELNIHAKFDLQHLLFVKATCWRRQDVEFPSQNLMAMIKRGCNNINKGLGEGARHIIPFGAAAIRCYWAVLKEELDEELLGLGL